LTSTTHCACCVDYGLTTAQQPVIIFGNSGGAKATAGSTNKT